MSTDNEYWVGAPLRLQITCRNAAGDLADPDTITLRVKDPSGNAASYNKAQLTKASTGIYYTDEDIDESGRWYWDVETTGDPAVTASTYFTARTRPIDA